MFKSKLIIFSLLLYLNFSINNAKALEYGLVTNEKSNSVSVIDLLSLEVIKELDVGPRPRGIGLAPDKSEIYIAVSGENKIKVIDFILSCRVFGKGIEDAMLLPLLEQSKAYEKDIFKNLGKM